MTRRGRWGGVVAALVCALCLSGCRVRLDLGVIGRSNGHLDLLVTVQADGDVRSALMRAGLLDGLTARALASRLADWDVAAQDDATLALVAHDVAPADAAGVVEDLVDAVGLGADVLSLDVTAVDGDVRRGLDATIDVGVPERTAFEGTPVDIDEDRWAEAMAAAREATTAAVWVVLDEPLDVDASNRASDVLGTARGRGLVWPLRIGDPARVGARPVGPDPSTWLLAAPALVIGALLGLLSARRRRRARRGGRAQA